MDLDDEELEATRKLNVVAKDSNIEEDKDVITLKNFIEIFNERKTKGDIATIDVLGEEIYSLENILTEREADKKRIKELEEENKRLKARIDVVNWQEKSVKEILEEKYIPKQKVIDEMEKLNKEIKHCDEIEAIFKIKQQQILQKILEDK